ncbi:hypothetical protein BD289DRAFT_425529 [Coniella lustricola]|uniref:DUF1308 domain-containing protein n=1 Tax=Coniella lustricola TaxID=2025994 RepID=A0A2T3AHL3_9PEZI|nr:hypothetical protein BD289DRAFT_425529 [Coniella lustricola]
MPSELETETSCASCEGYAKRLASDIVTRSQTLVQEMQDLRDQVSARKDCDAHISGLRRLIDSAGVELAAARSYLDAAEQDPVHGGKQWELSLASPQTAEARFRSSNLSAIEMHWSIIKRCRRLVAVHKQFCVPVKPNLYAKKAAQACAAKGPGPVSVHAVVDGGAEWVRIITKSPERLSHEMIEAGWDWGVPRPVDMWEELDEEAFMHDLVTLRQVKQMVDVAKAHWHNFLHPRIRIIFTRVRRYQNADLDMVLEKIHRLGVRNDITIYVETAESEWVTNEAPVDTAIAISNLLPRCPDVAELCEMPLLDTSILIALVSDMCHGHVETEPWMSHDLQSHIKDEQDGNHFVPYFTDFVGPRRSLRCTRPVADQLMEITTTMGTVTELERARILVSGGSSSDLQRLSCHPLIDKLPLPLEIIEPCDAEWSAKALVRDHILPHVALEVEKELDYMPSNCSTFLLGWALPCSIVTSNRALARKIVRSIEASLENDYPCGPHILALSYNRALLTSGPSPRRQEELQRLAAHTPI